MENQDILEFFSYLDGREDQLIEYLNPYFRKHSQCDTWYLNRSLVEPTKNENRFLDEYADVQELKRIVPQFSSMNELLEYLQSSFEYWSVNNSERDSREVTLRSDPAEFQRLLDYTRNYQSIKNSKVKCRN